MNSLLITRASNSELLLEWESGGSNDMIADSALALLSGVDCNGAVIKSEFKWGDTERRREPEEAYTSIRMPVVTSRPHDHSDHSHSHHTSSPGAKKELSPSSDQTQALRTEIDRLRMFLSAHFGPVEEPLMQEEEGREDELLVLKVDVDGVVAKVDLMTMVSTYL
jgi:cleavage and polyadenylation specificity factor subunit 3